MSLLILNANPTEPTNYLERKTAKGVIVNREGEVLMRGPYLIGGGVEEGESFEEALKREAMEEAGVEIAIMGQLGEVVSYRDALRKKYVAQGFLCQQIGQARTPTTTDPEELKQKLVCLAPEEALQLVEAQVEEIKNADKNLYEGDSYQSKLYNREMTLAFLKEAFK